MPVADAKAYAAEGKTFIANIAHDGDFWVASIPKKDIFESVSFQVEHFPPAEWLIAHTELRFNLNERITLYSQTRPGVKTSIKNFIVTVAAVQTVDGPDFDLLPAMQDYFALSKSIVSLNDKVATVVRDERNLVKQYPLKLDGEDLDRFWALLIERLHDPEFTELYHLFNRNCTNALFNVIDEFLGRERRRIDRIATTLPILSGGQLRRRKIVDLQKGMQTLNDEVNELTRPSVCRQVLRKFGLGPKEAR